MSYGICDLALFNLPHLQVLGVHHSSRTIARGRRINNYEGDVDVETATFTDGSDEVSNAKSLKKAAQSRLVVATLIATVSFTAGFTVPGGFDQNPGKNMGMPVFKGKPLFNVFMVSDAIAFITSTMAILVYFMLVSVIAKHFIHAFSLCGLVLNTISSRAMMITFLAGVSAISSHWLASIIIAISSVFFVVYCFLIFRTGSSLGYFTNKYHMGNRRVLR